MSNFFNVIKRPVISEKSTALAEAGNRYAFEVNSKSNKIEIRAAVQKLFGVNVTDVKTMMVPGKHKRVGANIVKRSNWKKAIVTLKDGQKIDFFNTK